MCVIWLKRLRKLRLFSSITLSIHRLSIKLNLLLTTLTNLIFVLWKFSHIYFNFNWISNIVQKKHVIFDVLFRLFTAAEDFGDSKSNNFDILNLNIFYNHLYLLTIINLTSYHESIQDFKSNTIYVYQELIIARFSKFKEKLLTNY